MYTVTASFPWNQQGIDCHHQLLDWFLSLLPEEPLLEAPYTRERLALSLTPPEPKSDASTSASSPVISLNSTRDLVNYLMTLFTTHTICFSPGPRFLKVMSQSSKIETGNLLKKKFIYQNFSLFRETKHTARAMHISCVCCIL